MPEQPVQQSVHVKPNSFEIKGLGEYLEEVVGHPVVSTMSLPPIFFFVTTPEIVEKIRAKYSDQATITVREIEA
ncbi:hypothetical protein FZEAL_3081 [Fusarium zealandicum]|uniref:Uncharacterized protein n=1 Tax=Fusarium zealandicum TaxID=1053134 RepID=A0A8H4XMT2_9HYPO|nr:hypothetical protein FZEAL_3081 [Fusarium zealandicum]